MEAEQAYRMATELDHEDVHALRNLALLYLTRGALPEALDLLRKIIPITPNDQDLWDAYSASLQR